MSGVCDRAGSGGATQGWAPSGGSRIGPRTRRMRTGSGIRDRRDAWAGKDALAIARGPWGVPRPQAVIGTVPEPLRVVFGI